MTEHARQATDPRPQDARRRRAAAPVVGIAARRRRVRVDQATGRFLRLRNRSWPTRTPPRSWA
ncbi:MAG: hypothetical protein LBE67_08560 [Kocuria palustris]|nr:hypothetical protein [Kocuria palustris]